MQVTEPSSRRVKQGQMADMTTPPAPVANQNATIADAEQGQSISLSLQDLMMEPTATQQQSLDRILDYMNQSALMPSYTVSGDLISLTLSLNSQFLSSLPADLADDGRVVMELITHTLCDYADAGGFTGFTLEMDFRK